MENYPDYIEKTFQFTIPPGQNPERIDIYLSRHIIHATRTKISKAIENGNITINGTIPKPSRKIMPGDEIICKLMKPPPMELIPENIPLEIVYEDKSLLIVNKPAGMVTHPGYGNRYGTLVNAVLYHFGMRESIPVEYNLDEDNVEEYDFDEGELFGSDAIRPGVVHRLDKNTSGLLVISKNSVVHTKIAEQFAQRTIDREYLAIVWGMINEDRGTISGNIGRSPRDRKLFAVIKKGGKYAITDYEVIERFDYLTLVKIKLRTGRTHQIRVHFSHQNHPVFGDQSYGGRNIVYGGNKQNWKYLVERCLKIATRQMLHAQTLGFIHPETGQKIYFNSELPADMKSMLEILREK